MVKAQVPEEAPAGPSVDLDMDMAYDPDQNPEERRGVRREYRTLDLRFEGTADGQSVNAKAVIETVNSANELFEKVKGTGEATLDSSLLLKASMKSAMLARAMKSGSGAFDVDDFVAKLITFMGGRGAAQMPEGSVDIDVYDDDEGDDTPLQWERIGWKALAKSRRVPAMDFMLGPLDVETKQRANIKRSKLEKNIEDQKKPQNITEEDIQRSDNETSHNVAVLRHVLDAVERINLFRFIINPDDFGQSVENLFYLSFLIRDGECALTFENGEPEIFACAAPDAEDYGAGLKKQQMVMELDMATWRRAIEVFDIKTSTLPARPKAQMRIGNKWYG